MPGARVRHRNAPGIRNGAPLADVTAENTVTNDVLDGTLTVAAQNEQSWNFVVNPNAISNAEVVGDVKSSGGLDGVITLTVFLQGQPTPVYKCRNTTCSIHQKLSAPGTMRWRWITGSRRYGPEQSTESFQ